MAHSLSAAGNGICTIYGSWRSSLRRADAGSLCKRDATRIMSKLLLFGLLGLVAYLVLRGMGRPNAPRPRGRREAERMVMCAHCGVHLPEGECLRSGKYCYCCERHRVLGPIEPRS